MQLSTVQCGIVRAVGYDVVRSTVLVVVCFLVSSDFV